MNGAGIHRQPKRVKCGGWRVRGITCLFFARCALGDVIYSIIWDRRMAFISLQWFPFAFSRAETVFSSEIHVFHFWTTDSVTRTVTVMWPPFFGR